VPTAVQTKEEGRGVPDFDSELTALQERVAELVSGLAFYADPTSWQPFSCRDEDGTAHTSPAPAVQDHGRRAQDLLARGDRQ